LVAENRIGDWRRSGLSVNVPADCPAQSIQLKGALGARFDPASAWFDDLALQRLDSAPPAALAAR
jgi:hypothetical protein